MNDYSPTPNQILTLLYKALGSPQPTGTADLIVMLANTLAAETGATLPAERPEVMPTAKTDLALNAHLHYVEQREAAGHTRAETHIAQIAARQSAELTARYAAVVAALLEHLAVMASEGYAIAAAVQLVDALAQQPD